MAERAEEERTKFALARIHGKEVVSPEQLREKPLSQILGVRRIVSASANERVDGIPIGATKFFQCGSCLSRVILSGQQHHTPVRRAKIWRAADQSVLTDLRVWHGSVHTRESRLSQAC